jgi:NADH-quinone oxidoreductase subunit H
VFTLLFLGGWNPLPWIPLSQVAAWLGATNPIAVGILSIVIFLGKVIALVFFFMWVRWTVPRFRYDQVMELGWKKLLPLSIGNLIFYAAMIAAIQTNQPYWVHAVIAAVTFASLAVVAVRPKSQATI